MGRTKKSEPTPRPLRLPRDADLAQCISEHAAELLNLVPPGKKAAEPAMSLDLEQVIETSATAPMAPPVQHRGCAAEQGLPGWDHDTVVRRGRMPLTSRVRRR